jgi:SAM-dependent methyltransferase
MTAMTDLSVPLIGGLRLSSGQITSGRRNSRSLRRRNAVIASSFELDGKRVLDVGCAEGLQSLYMSRSAREVYGVDHRMSEIETARATAGALDISNVRFESVDIRDPDWLRNAGQFDLAIAWGFLHRIGDIFALFYALEPIARAISLEWRTPVIPMMSSLSMAFHPPSRRPLDPMNTGRKADADDAGEITDADKVEGDSAFWEPTPGAVKAILRRLGYEHQKVLGYDENLVSENTILRRWHDHLNKVNSGARKLDDIPRARVHMLFEKEAGSIQLAERNVAEARIPEWDQALHKSLAKEQAAPVKKKADTHR